MNHDNRIALWKNDKREKDTHPHLTGQGTVDGVEYWVNAWTSKEGGKKPVVSISLKRKDSQRAPNPNPPQRESGDPGWDESDLPF